MKEIGTFQSCDENYNNVETHFLYLSNGDFGFAIYKIAEKRCFTKLENLKLFHLQVVKDSIRIFGEID